MSKHTHTQGEWDVNEFTDLEGDHHIQVVLKSNGCPLAHMYECGVETRPNARLIAAVPELLAALKAAIEEVEGTFPFAFLESAEAAIAKAEGA